MQLPIGIRHCAFLCVWLLQLTHVIVRISSFFFSLLSSSPQYMLFVEYYLKGKLFLYSQNILDTKCVGFSLTLINSDTIYLDLAQTLQRSAPHFRPQFQVPLVLMTNQL